MGFFDEKKGKKIRRKKNSAFPTAFGDMKLKNAFSDMKGGGNDAIQAKLEISSPGDIHEQQADDIARKVVSGEHAGMEVSASANTVMAQSEEGGLYADDSLQGELDSTKGSGMALDENTQSEMESSMDADLSDVRIHTGSMASEMSESINAKAFTHGQDIYFRDGNYDPNSAEGKELLAHELVHTQQQKGGVKRRIQRAMKFEFQTGNYVWAIKNSGPPDPVLLPRKYHAGSTSYKDDTSGASQEDGGKPAYLSVGEHGKSRREQGYSYVEMKGPLVMKEVNEVPFNMVQAKANVDMSKPPQYVVHTKVYNLDKYLEQDVIPDEKDLVSFKKENKSDFPLTYPIASYNAFTYQFVFYDGDNYISEEKPVIGPAYENMPLEVYMDDNGMLKSGPRRYMVKKKEKGIKEEWVDLDKPAHIIREYQFTSPVSLDDIVGKEPEEGQLKLIKETNNALLLESGMYNPNTFEFKYLDYTGSQLDLHVSPEGKFERKHVRLMKVERGEHPDLRTKNAQYLQIYKITIDPNGTVDYDGQKATVQQVGKTLANKPPYLPGTYEKKYYLSSDFEGEKLKEDAVMQELHLSKDVRELKKGHVKFMEYKKLPASDQSAIELQAEHGGYLEFETPKWLDEWKEMKQRIQDAVDMTEAFNTSMPVDSGISSEIDKRKTSSILGTIVEWPKEYSIGHLTNLIADDRRLVVQIINPRWRARIQSSYEISMSQYADLLSAAGSGSVDYNITTIEAGKQAFDTAFNEVRGKTDKPKLKDNGILKELDLTKVNESELGNLLGFVQMITNYLLRGQHTDKSGSIAKDLIQLMSRTSFYSIYHSILSEKERLLFKYMVINNTITRDLEKPFNTFLADNMTGSSPDKVADGFASGAAYIYRKGHKKGKGPRIKEWLNSIIYGYVDNNKRQVSSDKLSPPETGSKAMGIHQVEENRVRFELRYSNTHLGGQDRPASEWVQYAHDLFNWAAQRGDTPDDPATPGTNEAATTGLKGANR